jgi:hypothetical protein
MPPLPLDPYRHCVPGFWPAIPRDIHVGQIIRRRRHKRQDPTLTAWRKLVGLQPFEMAVSGRKRHVVLAGMIDCANRTLYLTIHGQPHGPDTSTWLWPNRSMPCPDNRTQVPVNAIGGRLIDGHLHAQGQLRCVPGLVYRPDRYHDILERSSLYYGALIGPYPSP